MKHDVDKRFAWGGVLTHSRPDIYTVGVGHRSVHYRTNYEVGDVRNVARDEYPRAATIRLPSEFDRDTDIC